MYFVNIEKKEKAPAESFRFLARGCIIVCMADALLFLSIIVGFAVSFYIFYKRTRREHLTCFLEDDCNEVMNSKYSKILRVPNEVLGMLYYAFAMIVFALLMFGVQSLGPFAVFSVFLASAMGAALFSVFLVFVQFFMLKQRCEYCLTSATASILILFFLLLR